MPASFDGDVAVVTGAGARTERALGIGEATARRFAEDGATVVVVDADEAMAERTAGIIEEEGGTAHALAADVTDEADLQALAEHCEGEFGAIDALVNNVGIRIESGPVTDHDRDDVDRIVAVNLVGTIRTCAHLLPLVERGDGGAVVNVASAAAHVGRPGWGPYDATKSALVALTRDMACDHAAAGVRVNAVSPGWTITDYHLPEDDDAAAERIEQWSTPTPDGFAVLKRAAMPREQADAIHFLASDAASFVTGTTMHVDGGREAVGHDVDVGFDEA